MKKKNSHAEKKSVIPFQNEFNHISAFDLEEIMEWLQDNEYLSKKGVTFRNAFWGLFIKNNK